MEQAIAKPTMKKGVGIPSNVFVLVAKSCLALLLLTILFIKEFVFVHGLGLITLFRPNHAATPPPVRLNISYWNKLQIRIILLLRYIGKSQFLLQGWYKRIHNDILASIKAQNLDPQQFQVPIAVVQPEEITAREFWHNYVNRGVPVVIKGGAKNSAAFKNWTPDSFAERFGDLELSIFDQTNSEHFVGSIRDIVASRGSDRRLYLYGGANVITYNPELLDELDCFSYREHMGGDSFLGGGNLFLSVHPTTGSDFHCAGNTNLFFQIHGKKKWTFVHPEYTPLLYPMLNRFLFVITSFIKRKYTPEFLDTYFPLHRYCPKAEIVLEPGDILMNPPWQWHSVDNVSDSSISVATRWFPRRMKRTNALFHLLTLWNLPHWKVKFRAILTKRGYLVMNDSFSRNLIKSDDDYVDFGKPQSRDKWNPENWSAEDKF